MNPPVWIRENGGIGNKPAGLPYPDPAVFAEWVNAIVGSVGGIEEIVLIGLTLDCCVLCAAQELSFRGYRVRFLVEAEDTYTGSVEDRRAILNIPLANWGHPIPWTQSGDLTS